MDSREFDQERGVGNVESKRCIQMKTTRRAIFPAWKDSKVECTKGDTTYVVGRF